MKNMKWSAEKRLEFIDFRLFWEGTINRADITKQFSVSVPQASKDLSIYQETAPKNLEYDKSAKYYYRTELFEPAFLKPDTESYLSQLRDFSDNSHKDSWVSISSDVAVMPIPRRKVCPYILQKILSAVRTNKSIAIKYQSMNPNKPDPEWRDISPHAFCSDGFRWHVRSYCHHDSKFKDFLLSRMIEVGAIKEKSIDPQQDTLWHKVFSVYLVPNPELSEGQKKIIENDYEMKNGKLELPVRYSLLYYFSKRHRFDMPTEDKSPSETPIIIDNEQEFKTALLEARG